MQQVEGVTLQVLQYEQPRAEPPPHPQYRLVYAGVNAVRGPFAVLPVLKNRRGGPVACRGLPIVDFNGGAFVVVSHAWVDRGLYNGTFATLLFEDGHYLLDPAAGDTGAFDETCGALRPTLVASVGSPASLGSAGQRPLMPGSPGAAEPDSDSDVPQQPSKKPKRKSRAYAEVLMAAAV